MPFPSKFHHLAYPNIRLFLAYLSDNTVDLLTRNWGCGRVDLQSRLKGLGKSFEKENTLSDEAEQSAAPRGVRQADGPHILDVEHDVHQDGRGRADHDPQDRVGRGAGAARELPAHRASSTEKPPPYGRTWCASNRASHRNHRTGDRCGGGPYELFEGRPVKSRQASGIVCLLIPPVRLSRGQSNLGTPSDWRTRSGAPSGLKERTSQVQRSISHCALTGSRCER